jgi:CDP-paratose 2-epimerase
MYQFYLNPRCAEVYNLGGGKQNSCSILEAFELTKNITGVDQRYTYLEQNRNGDHVCYYSDLRKMKSHYPNWSITKSLPQIIDEIARAWKQRLA